MDLFSSIPQHPLLSTHNGTHNSGDDEKERARAGQIKFSALSLASHVINRFCCWRMSDPYEVELEAASMLTVGISLGVFLSLSHFHSFPHHFFFLLIIHHCFSLSTSCRKKINVRRRRRWRRNWETKNNLRCSTLSKQIKFYGKHIKRMFDWRLATKCDMTRWPQII